MPDYRPAFPVDSPSGMAIMGENVGAPMDDAAIADSLAAFATAAREAKALGFDGVELHGAHGYLIDQFFFPVTNRRRDRWGGDTVSDRTRFAVELVRQVRQAIGPDFPLILRLSQWKSGHFDAKIATSPEEMRLWLEPLAEAGVDAFHCSQRRFWEPEFAGSDLNFAGWARKLTGKPTITVGSVGLTNEFTARGERSQPTGIDELLRRLERGDFDLVAIGRALIVNPDWPKIIREGRTEALRDYDATALQTLD
jgi:2,4-dienoyl-CoA reductase-like NADH-dependent reductase (Old Yellow Enzyme family)